MLLLIIIATSSFATIVAKENSVGRESVKATQNRVEKNLELAQFDVVKFNVAGADIQIRQGEGHRVEISGEKELVDQIVVEFKESKLYIYTNKGDRRVSISRKKEINKVAITLYAANYTKVENKGVGNLHFAGDFELWNIEVESKGVGKVSSDNLRAHKAKFEAEGVGTMTLKGASHTLIIESEGVGNIDAGEMSSLYATVKSEGVGNIVCRASREIDIISSGIGNVIYKGNPPIKRVVQKGIGRVIEQ